MQKKLKNILKIKTPVLALSIFWGIIVIAFSITMFAMAQWDPPTNSPPSNNVAEPLNVTGTFQSKSGAIAIEGNFFETFNETNLATVDDGVTIGYDPSGIPTPPDNALWVEGQVGIGTTDPTGGLHVVGNTVIQNGSLGFQNGGALNIGEWASDWSSFNAGYIFSASRFQLGNGATGWINDALTGFNEPVVSNDTFIFVPGYTGVETSDLRLYILDNAQDRFSIWGDSCGGGGCSNLDAATEAHYFTGGGDAYHAGDLTVGGNIIGTGSLPGGSPDQTLRHNGTDWVAVSNLFNTGNTVGTTGPLAREGYYDGIVYGYNVSPSAGGWVKLKTNIPFQHATMMSMVQIDVWRYGGSYSMRLGWYQWNGGSGVDFYSPSYDYLGGGPPPEVRLVEENGLVTIVVQNNGIWDAFPKMTARMIARPHGFDTSWLEGWSFVSEDPNASAIDTHIFTEPTNQFGNVYINGETRLLDTGFTDCTALETDGNGIIQCGVDDGEGGSGLNLAGNPGDTIYHDGSDWSNTGNLYHDGTNVGIGGTPSAKFQVSNGTVGDSNTAGFLRLEAGSSNAALRAGLNTDYAWIQSHGSRPLRINELGNDVIINSGAGSVGIGTPTPGAKLDVFNTTDNILRLTRDDATDDIFDFRLGTDGALVLATGTSAVNTAFIKFGNQNSRGIAIGDLFTGSTPPPDGLTVEGRVGIGTSTPDPLVQLHVIGNVRVNALNGGGAGCTALETDGSGNILCGDDDTGSGAGDGDWNIQGNDMISGVSGDVGVIGSPSGNKVINGNFETHTPVPCNGWTRGVDWACDTAVGLGGARKNGLGTSTLSQDTGEKAGEVYEVTYTIRDWTQGDIRVIIGARSGSLQSGNGTYTETLRAINTGDLTFADIDGDFQGVIDNVSVATYGGGNLYATGSIIAGQDQLFDYISLNATATESVIHGRDNRLELRTNDNAAFDIALLPGAGANVGIGTTDPITQLHTTGTVFFDCEPCGGSGVGDLNGNSFWGNMAIQGRVLSADNNIHLSPPGGDYVIINNDYRAAGGATGGTAGLQVEGNITAGITGGPTYYTQLIIESNEYWAGIELRTRNNVDVNGGGLSSGNPHIDFSRNYSGENYDIRLHAPNDGELHLNGGDLVIPGGGLCVDSDGNCNSPAGRVTLASIQGTDSTGSYIEVYDSLYLPTGGTSIRSTGHHEINNTSPTLYLRDSDDRSSMVHTNNNYWYVLRGCAVNSTSWCQLNSRWPLQINLETNDASFGRNVWAIGFYYASDESLKENIRPLESSLDKILQLEGVSYNWKADGRLDMGLIAQDVEKVFPELVKMSDPGAGESLKTIDYGHLTGPIIEAIKEQQAQIEDLKNDVEMLKAEIEVSN